MLFGGLGGSGRLNDTWEWDGASKTWTNVTPTSSPAKRWRHALAYDAARRTVVLFGGDTGTFVNDTWEYHTHGGACSCAGGGNCVSTACDTGYCVDGVCCEGASLATASPPNCATCARCDSAASPGACATVTNAQDPDSCAGADTCGPTGVCGLPNGTACGAVSDCASGFCVDGVCCDTACAGGCDACNGAWSGAVTGTCAIAPAAYAGAPSCTPYQCNGTNPACPNPCATDTDCVTGSSPFKVPSFVIARVTSPWRHEGCPCDGSSSARASSGREDDA